MPKTIKCAQWRDQARKSANTSKILIKSTSKEHEIRQLPDASNRISRLGQRQITNSNNKKPYAADQGGAKDQFCGHTSMPLPLRYDSPQKRRRSAPNFKSLEVTSCNTTINRIDNSVSVSCLIRSKMLDHSPNLIWSSKSTERHLFHI